MVESKLELNMVESKLELNMVESKFKIVKGSWSGGK